MPTYTTTYSLGKPVVGADEDAWGDTLNTSLDAIDDLLDGTTPVTGIDINSGTLDGVTIGGTTAGAGTFTNLTATGTTTLAGASTSADITFGDNDKAIFGAGSDLQIYHDAVSNRSYITESNTDGNGHFFIQGDNLILENTGGENYFRAINGGAVQLYYSGSEKLATTSTGIYVTGTVVSDGLNVGTGEYITFGTPGDTTNSIRAYGNDGLTYHRAYNGFVFEGTNGGTNERMRIDSSGNVGIGVSNPSDYYSTKLVVDAGTGEDGITIKSSTLAEAYLMFADGTNGSDAYRGFIGYNHASNYLRFGTDGSEDMRIDSSGNLLVGKSSSNSASVGVEARANGTLFATKASSNPAGFNRTTSDGAIVNFYKDNSTVGSIGTYGGDVYIGTGDAALWFQDGGNAIRPFRVDTQVGHDASIDLGHSSNRFKDLYLSGGVFLGGTGSSNKLDDYEEGGWTPTLPNGGTVGTIVKSAYIKVGNLVNVYCNVYLNPTNNSTQFKIGGLPFAAVSNNHGGGTLSYTGGMETRYWSAPLVDTGSAVYFHRHDASTAVVLNNAFGGVNRQFIMQLTYTLV